MMMDDRVKQPFIARAIWKFPNCAWSVYQLLIVKSFFFPTKCILHNVIKGLKWLLINR
jgi:hypothetical protein